MQRWTFVEIQKQVDNFFSCSTFYLFGKATHNLDTSLMNLKIGIQSQMSSTSSTVIRVSIISYSLLVFNWLITGSIRNQWHMRHSLIWHAHYHLMVHDSNHVILDIFITFFSSQVLMKRIKSMSGTFNNKQHNWIWK